MTKLEGLKMKRTILLTMCAAMLLLAGCGEKKCFFVTQDGKGVNEGAIVVWGQEVVGKVDALVEVDGGTKIAIKFAKKYQNLIHDGVLGRVEPDESLPLKFKIVLIDGRDENRPILKDGDQIPESKQENSGIESGGIVGYQILTIEKGETDISMPFVKGYNDGKGQFFFTLETFKEIAEEGDEVCFYDSTSNLIFMARAEKVRDGFHFFSEKTGEVVDSCLYLPVLYSGSKLCIRYKRVKDVSSQLTVGGNVFQFENVGFDKDIVDMKSLSDWMRWRICHQIFKAKKEDVFMDIVKEADFAKALDTKPGFIQAILKSAKQRPFLFYMFEGGNCARLVAFDPTTGTFTDGERGHDLEIDSAKVSRFGGVINEYAKSKIPLEQRLPTDIVDELNQLLKDRFFDEKNLCELVFMDGTTRCVTIDPETKSVRDARKGMAYNLSRSDIVGLRSIPNSNDVNVAYASIRGKVHFLSEEDVRDYEANLIPARESKIWLGMIYLIQAFISALLGVIMTSLFPPGTSVFKKILLVLSGILLVIWLVQLIKKVISCARPATSASADSSCSSGSTGICSNIQTRVCDGHSDKA